MNSIPEKRGNVRLSSGAVIEPFVVDLLGSRGIHGQESIREFLEPKLSTLPDPFLMKGMESAVRIIESAIREEQKILIWGDYDVDGTTATSLLIKFFKILGVAVDYYIPNRLNEGYGLQCEALTRITGEAYRNSKVLITVDNGISAHEAVCQARKLGYRVIVTDHHTPPEVGVEADAILNPKQIDCPFPDKNLAGVGVAFYLVMGLRGWLKKKSFFGPNRPLPNLKDLLDLVALGTVADMVPLHGANRVLVRAGMEIMAKKLNPGVTALCKATNIDPGLIRSEDISFQLGPKINAAGRLGDADKAVSLLLETDKSVAKVLAKGLVKNNEARRSINISELVNALREIGQASELKNSAIVAGVYHVGVAGIVASGLVGEFNRPSVVLCKCEDGTYKGSARSIPGVDLYVILSKCSEILIGFGGHKMAGGLSLKDCNVLKFKELFDSLVFDQTKGLYEEAVATFDAEITIEELFKHSTLRQLHLLEPFGQGNPQPIFSDTEVRFSEIMAIGKDKSHLRVSFKGKSGKITKGIAFGMGALAENCRASKTSSVLYTPSLNFFRGKRNWQARVVDIVFP